ncbi:MAG: Holliday junction branch migration protein RuvA [Clostridia bacterium]|nr:Holliday junction branch migration protein RuvA [Clostridia bacterium]
MIGYLKGTLISVQNGKVLLDVGGVGYEISISNNTVVKLPAVDNQATIYTYLYVREDEMSLFGFYSLEEKAMFMKLISISGIGPKAAMSILSGMELRALAIAIITEDKKSIAKIKGVGKKTAERIILELKEKVTAEEGDVETTSSSKKPFMSGVEIDTDMEDAIMALRTLGIQQASAVRAVTSARAISKTTEELIMNSLKALNY